MKTAFFVIGLLIVLFFQFVQIGEFKKLQQAQQIPKDPRSGEIEQVRGYLDLVDRFSDVAKDPSRTGAAAVLYARELNKGLSREAMIEYWNKLLPDVRDEAVRRAIRLQLVELYSRGGAAEEREKAMNELRTLITGAPGS